MKRSIYRTIISFVLTGALAIQSVVPAYAAADEIRLINDLSSEGNGRCPTPCDPIDGSPPGSPIPGILQAMTLEWVAISFSNA